MNYKKGDIFLYNPNKRKNNGKHLYKEFYTYYHIAVYLCEVGIEPPQVIKNNLSHFFNYHKIYDIFNGWTHCSSKEFIRDYEIIKDNKYNKAMCVANRLTKTFDGICDIIKQF